MLEEWCPGARFVTASLHKTLTAGRFTLAAVPTLYKFYSYKVSHSSQSISPYSLPHDTDLYLHEFFSSGLKMFLITSDSQRILV